MRMNLGQYQGMDDAVDLGFSEVARLLRFVPTEAIWATTTHYAGGTWQGRQGSEYTERQKQLARAMLKFLRRAPGRYNFGEVVFECNALVSNQNRSALQHLVAQGLVLCTGEARATRYWADPTRREEEIEWILIK